MWAPAHGPLQLPPCPQVTTEASFSCMPSSWGLSLGCPTQPLSTPFTDPLLSLHVLHSALPLDLGSLPILQPGLRQQLFFALGLMSMNSPTPLPILSSCNLGLSRGCLFSSHSLLCHTMMVRQKSTTLCDQNWYVCSGGSNDVMCSLTLISSFS